MNAITNSRPAAVSILIVEDDKVAGKMLGRIIAQELSDVIINIAEDGEQGVELFKAHLPDIVITDINMSVMDGIQMAMEIKSVKADTRFIVLTGYSDQRYMEMFNEIGVNDYIVKPIDFVKLFAALEKCIGELNNNPSDGANIN